MPKFSESLKDNTNQIFNASNSKMMEITAYAY